MYYREHLEEDEEDPEHPVYCEGDAFLQSIFCWALMLWSLLSLATTRCLEGFLATPIPTRISNPKSNFRKANVVFSREICVFPT